MRVASGVVIATFNLLATSAGEIEASEMKKDTSISYTAAGVDLRLKEAGLSELGAWVNRTFALNPSRPILPLGYFANVIKLSPEHGLAISTDGVGTKLLIAQALGKYDTVGIDCVAMNANDVICVGARPVSMVDYIAVQKIEPGFLGELARDSTSARSRRRSIFRPARSRRSRELIRDDVRPGDGFDLVGTCIGTVPLDRIIIGQAIEPGDAVVGIASSGLHSNGFTLARSVLFRQPMAPLSEHRGAGQDTRRSALAPTQIYVAKWRRCSMPGSLSRRLSISPATDS